MTSWSRWYGNRAFYLDPSHYLDVMPDRDHFVERLHDELARSKAPTIARYAPGSDYAAVPIWAAVERFSFGALSKMMEYAADDGPARSTADSLSVPWSTFTSTVHGHGFVRGSGRSRGVDRAVGTRLGRMW